MSEWHEANHRYLQAELDRLGGALDRFRTRALQADGAPTPEPDWNPMLPPPTLATVQALFGLSPFERDLLLLCAGPELDAAFAARLTAAHGRPLPTFSLALEVLEGAHWSALTPAAPLRAWQLVEVLPGDTLLGSPLRVDERILHMLVGVSYLDERLEPPIAPLATADWSAPSQAEAVGRAVQLWQRASALGGPPVIWLCGPDAGARRSVAAAVCRELGLATFVLHAADIPAAGPDRERLSRLWEREAALTGGALLIECDGYESPEALRTAAAFADAGHAPVFLAAQESLPLRQRNTVRIEAGRPNPTELRELWESLLGPEAAALNGDLDRVISQFALSTRAIHHVVAGLSAGAAPADLGEALWQACRMEARPLLGELAQRIEPTAGWEELVLPPHQTQMLRDIAAHVRQQARVYDDWGFRAQGARGLGITALFAGGSGTGKTMAAEVLSRELRLDLYRIDLSAVVSKYIGETEKNLRRIFDAAETGGAILLFDEADALFGKRSEVRDSHDRYANIEVGYLLQRMEAYRGLAILTTNIKSALDSAFLRRIRFLVEFPFPDPAGRAEIWRRVFPPQTPARGLEVERLAQLNVAGGSIRNIALGAAFLAAEEGEPVSMRHILRVARTEYAKLEKTLTATETGGWDL